MTQLKTVRPTKKQQELLQFIDAFIGQHGYSPSYREIMNGLDYTSVATVALHVGNLIRRGHLIKRDRSARSLELATKVDEITDTAAPEQWLLDHIEARFAAEEPDIEALETLVKALLILELPAAEAFQERLEALRS
ncbi:MAG: hypothetical protein JWM37_33 [Candidatus Saccharibacteria bacterium]|nr:hypothetical protein [Candidatus Saccharibacteria bacterium]